MNTGRDESDSDGTARSLEFIVWLKIVGSFCGYQIRRLLFMIAKHLRSKFIYNTMQLYNRFRLTLINYCFIYLEFDIILLVI